MTDILDIFPDTSEPLSTREEDYLENLNTSENGWKRILHNDTGLLDKLVVSLINKGFLAFCHVAESLYLYMPNVVSVKTVAFHLPQIKMEKDAQGKLSVLDRNERNKQAYARRLIAEWIYGVTKIDDTQAAKYFDLYTFKMFWILSCPDFLWEKLEQMLLDADIDTRVLTPEQLTITCRQCGTFFDTVIGVKKVRCPKCRRIAITNIA